MKNEFITITCAGPARRNLSAWRRRRAHHVGGSWEGTKVSAPGCPDVLGQLKDNRLLGVEVKSRTGKRHPEQSIFLERINAARRCICCSQLP